MIELRNVKYPCFCLAQRRPILSRGQHVESSQRMEDGKEILLVFLTLVSSATHFSYQSTLLHFWWSQFKFDLQPIYWITDWIMTTMMNIRQGYLLVSPISLVICKFIFVWHLCLTYLQRYVNFYLALKTIENYFLFLEWNFPILISKKELWIGIFFLNFFSLWSYRHSFSSFFFL